jgi:dihydrofolate synthase/folylpolyglutamate synthase
MKNKKDSFADFIIDKPLYYKEIDHERVHIAYDILKSHIKKPIVIHLVGTNGKGSTGRIIATLLHHSSYRVGHFSSPHLFKFNERIWIEGKDISDESLDNYHGRLYSILGETLSNALSHFEYTTLLALLAMEELDIIVLEAGLGGEFDATNVVSKELSVITPIGIDHQDFLGEDIESIASTKLNSIDKRVVLGIQRNQEVYHIAEKIVKRKKTELYIVRDSNKKLLDLTKKLDWSYYLYENALLAINSLDILNLSYNIENLKLVKLFGRFYQISRNVTIDVGHNLLAVDAICTALEQKYGDNRIVLVYNSLDDKDYSAILKRLKKYIKRVEIIPINTKRSVPIIELHTVLRENFIEYKEFETIENDENYLVFGSFFVVESFIKNIYFKYK